MVRIDNDNLHLMLEEAKRTKVVSNDLGAAFLQLANNILGKSRYRGYSEDVKNDLVYNSMIPMCKYCFNYDQSKASGNTPAFSYCTRIIEMNFWSTLNKHYAKKEIKESNLEEESYNSLIEHNMLFDKEEDEKLTNIYNRCMDAVSRMDIKDRMIAAILWGFGDIEDFEDCESITSNDIRKNRVRIWRAIKSEFE